MTRKLPSSPADLRGLRAARWIRESRPGQLDNSGPAAQRFEQDEAIERLHLVDTGIEWEAGHSGWKASAIATSEKWADMLERAGRDYDVLVVGYVSRFCRNVNIGTSIREQLHASGAAIYFSDEGILSSNEDEWKRWVDLLVEAEHYSRNLQRTMERTYKTKWRTFTDPGGMAPLGFRRTGGKPSVLEVDPQTIRQVIHLFKRFAIGISTRQLAEETGLHEERIKPILRNRIYNGFVQRYGEWREAAWRSNPPIDDELWDRVVAMRESKSHGGGPRRTDRVDLLNGLLYCSCGQKLWSEPGEKGYRKRHRQPCAAWGLPERRTARTWEIPILAQVHQVDLSPETIARVAQVLAAPSVSRMELVRKQIERDRRNLAERYAKGTIDGPDFLTQDSALRDRLATLDREDAAQVDAITLEAAVAYLQGLASTFAEADGREQGDLMRSIYDRIEVEGPRFVGVALTREAKAHGLEEALPESVVVPFAGVRVGGEGLEPPTPSV